MRFDGCIRSYFSPRSHLTSHLSPLTSPLTAHVTAHVTTTALRRLGLCFGIMFRKRSVQCFNSTSSIHNTLVSAKCRWAGADRKALYRGIPSRKFSDWVSLVALHFFVLFFCLSRSAPMFLRTNLLEVELDLVYRCTCIMCCTCILSPFLWSAGAATLSPFLEVLVLHSIVLFLKCWCCNQSFLFFVICPAAMHAVCVPLDRSFLECSPLTYNPFRTAHTF